MRTSWALGSVVAGAAMIGYAIASVLLDLGGPEASETLGAMVLLLGMFLLAEGALSLRRSARLDGPQSRDKP